MTAIRLPPAVRRLWARFELYKGRDAQHYFQLLAGNGEKVLRSEGYKALSGAKNGIKSVVKHAADEASFRVLEAKNGEFYFRLKAGNGEVILTSEGYKAKASAKNGVASVQKNCGDNACYETKEAKNGKHYFVLKAANRQVIGQSQMYKDAASCKKGMASVKRNGSTDKVVEA